MNPAPVVAAGLRLRACCWFFAMAAIVGIMLLPPELPPRILSRPSAGPREEGA